MKLIPRFLAAGAAFLLGLAPLPAQSRLPVSQTITVGGLTTQAGGQAWAYLFWQTDAMDLISAHSYSIWQKSGNAAAAGNYSRIGIVTLQSDPPAVGSIIQRATLALGENQVELDQTVSSLFEKLMPTLTEIPPEQRLAAKVSAVLRGVKTDPLQLQSLLLAARYHPAVAMAAGQAYAAKIPVSGPVTFEVREYLAATQTDAAVLGRVTVDNAVPLILPVPSVVGQVPELAQQGFNHLNIKILWDTPDSLRRVQPVTQGFNLYRVKRATAEGFGWHTTAPPSWKLANLSGIAGSNVGRVNRAAITAKKMLTPLEVQNASTGDQFFLDEAMRMPGFPDVAARPKNGDQYYYFVTSRDLLGRDNAGPLSNAQASPGLLATFCDSLMPDTPVDVKATNEYVWNNGATAQNLRVTWKANDNAGPKKTAAYLVYRWDTSDGPVLHPLGTPLPDSVDPLSHLIAGPIPHEDGQASFSYLDNGQGSPSVPADLNRTFWYTVRAVDRSDLERPPGGKVRVSSPFGGNLSPNSPSGYGTLRNRTGPDAPAAIAEILCPVPGILGLKTERTDDATLDPSTRYVELIATRPVAEENIAAVDFERQTGATTWVSLGRVNFTPGAVSLTKYFNFAPGSMGTGLTVRARAVNATGEVSSFASSSIGQPPALAILRATWKTSVTYTRVPVVAGSTVPRCPAHSPPGPGTGVTAVDGNGVIVKFFPTAGTRQYKLYYRIDSGPLTLIKEDSGGFDTTQQQTIAFNLSPASSSEVCLFLQVFDKDGNPSAMKALGCYPIKGSTALPKPMLAPITSSGSPNAPYAVFQWFCPPPGVEKFEVWIGSSPTDLPDALGSLLNLNAANPSQTSMEKISATQSANFTYQVYHTERIGPLFGNGSVFTVPVPLLVPQKLRVKVRAVSEAGDAGPFSNVELYQWAAPPGFSGPDVPWPARPLPDIADPAKFSSSVGPLYIAAEGYVGISLGAVATASHAVAVPSSNPAQFPDRVVTQIKSDEVPESFLFTALFHNPDITRHALPCVLYRTQVPDGASPPNYPTVPGDVVQVSPLMESIAFASEAYPGGGNGVTIYDPFIAVTSVPVGEVKLNILMLKDTTPVLSGARYLYLLVLMDPLTHEIERVLPLPTIDIP